MTTDRPIIARTRDGSPVYGLPRVPDTRTLEERQRWADAIAATSQGPSEQRHDRRQR